MLDELAGMLQEAAWNVDDGWCGETEHCRALIRPCPADKAGLYHIPIVVVPKTGLLRDLQGTTISLTRLGSPVGAVVGALGAAGTVLFRDRPAAEYCARVTALPLAQRSSDPLRRRLAALAGRLAPEAHEALERVTEAFAIPAGLVPALAHGAYGATLPDLGGPAAAGIRGDGAALHSWTLSTADNTFTVRLEADSSRLEARLFATDPRWLGPIAMLWSPEPPVDDDGSELMFAVLAPDGPIVRRASGPGLAANGGSEDEADLCPTWSARLDLGPASRRVSMWLPASPWPVDALGPPMLPASVLQASVRAADARSREAWRAWATENADVPEAARGAILAATATKAGRA